MRPHTLLVALSILSLTTAAAFGQTLGAVLTLSLGITGTVTVLALTKTVVVAPQGVRDLGRCGPSVSRESGGE